MDLQQWQGWLSRYVDDRGRVDYAAWQQHSYSELGSWLGSWRDGKIPSDREAQLALWLNLYNALTIYQVLERYPITSIRPTTALGIPNWFSFLCFFKRKSLQAAGQSVSLDTIEHDILRGQLQDYRVHFALVCASIGCPLLRNQAYFPGKINQQLEEDATRFINNPEKVTYDPDTRILYCSKIFKWYRQDFLRISNSIQEFILLYLDLQLPWKKQITASTPISYLPYDWSLNQRTSS